MRAVVLRQVIRGVRVDPERLRAGGGALPRALADAAAGRLAPVIDQTSPLERAADAHAAIESRRIVGKTLLVAPGAGPGRRPAGARNDGGRRMTMGS